MSKENEAKILLLDIETSPILGYTWGKYEQNVLDIVQDWQILSFSAKWLGDKKIVTKAIPDYKSANNPTDYYLAHDLARLLEEADVVVGHNCDEFDIKKINARLTYWKIKPPSSYKTIDTKKVAKSSFGFTSNSLTDLGQYLGLGKKVETGGFGLWKGCMAGDKKAWKKMKEYNEQDVILLEKIYLHFRPWIKNHPTLGLYSKDGRETCPKCGGKKLEKNGLRITRTRKYQRYRCQNCGGNCQSVLSEKTKPPLVSI